MKIKNILITFPAVLIWAGFTGCDNEDDSSAYVSNFAYEKSLSLQTNEAPQETLTLKALDNDNLQITHKNIWLPCCEEIPFAEVASLTGHLYINNIDLKQAACSCASLYSLTYTVKNLKEDHYIVSLNNHYSFYLNINAATDTTIIVKQTVD